MRGDESSRFEPWSLLPAKPRALTINDGKARPEIGCIEIDTHPRPQFTYDEGRRPTPAAIQATRPVQVVPLRLVFAGAIEYLNTVVLAIGNVDPAVFIRGMLCAILNCPGSLPDSPHDISSLPAGENLCTRALP